MGFLGKPFDGEDRPQIVTAAISRRGSQLVQEAQDRLETLLSRDRARLHQGAVIGNASARSFRLWQMPTPRQGAWSIKPDSTLEGVPCAQTAFVAWKASGNAPANILDIGLPEDLNEGMQHLLSVWAEHSFVMAPTAIFGLKSRGGGVEGLSVFHDEAREYGLAFYLHTSDTGTDISAGAAILAFDEMKAQLARDDGHLTDLRRLIQCGEGDAVGLSRGDTRILCRGDVRISFRAAHTVTFLVAGSP